MEDGVRTRARPALAMGGGAASSAAQSPKRRKIDNSEQEFVHHKAPVKTTETEERPNSDDVQAASCCSSNGSVGHDEERNDLEVESALHQIETSSCNCGEEIQRREMSNASKNEETSKKMEESSMEANSRPPASTASRRWRPTAAEVEEFFAASEKEMQTSFKEKYNFDIVKDQPLEGRYEWVQLKP